MLTSLAFDSPGNQRFRLRVLSSSLRKDLKLLSKIFDLDEIDCEIICLVKDKFRVQAKEIALHIYLSRDAARRRAIKLKEKEILEMVQAKARSPGVIYFRLSSKIRLFLDEIKKSGLVDFSRESFLKSHSVKNFAYVRKLQKNLSLEGLIRSLPATRRDVFFLVVTLTKATSPLIADELKISPQAIRYHLEWLRKRQWIDRREFTDNPNAYYYFVNPEIDRQILQLIVNAEQHALKLNKKMDDEPSKLLEQEILKLDALDKDLLIKICSHPGSPSKELGNNLEYPDRTINKHLNKLIKFKLAIREKDSDFPGVRYCYYPTLGLTIELIERFIDLSTFTDTNHIDTAENINMNDLNGLTSTSSSNTRSSAKVDVFAKLNYIEEQKKLIEEEEKRIQKRKSDIKNVEQELIGQFGEEAEKFFSIKN